MQWLSSSWFGAGFQKPGSDRWRRLGGANTYSVSFTEAKRCSGTALSVLKKGTFVLCLDFLVRGQQLPTITMALLRPGKGIAIIGDSKDR
jgi:hypothetical protein